MAGCANKLGCLLVNEFPKYLVESIMSLSYNVPLDKLYTCKHEHPRYHKLEIMEVYFTFGKVLFPGLGVYIR